MGDLTFKAAYTAVALWPLWLWAATRLTTRWLRRPGDEHRT